MTMTRRFDSCLRYREKQLRSVNPKTNFYEVRNMKSVISDLVDRIEGYKDVPDYDIESICHYGDGRIVIRIRPQQSETAEPGAQNESN